ncbi:MAG: DUF2079 domain-containing protein [Candidatus Omnitrophica bacterium]|nr:DUF2079 domain-containing protein [Candidatus Omnitrophota bacterium]
MYVLLALLILGYTCYFSYYTILNHYKLGTSTCDFTIFQNAFINTLHGNFMSVSISPFDGRSLLSQHHDFIFLVYLPFFYLFPKSETLLIIQSASIAFAALPLFLFGKKVLKSTPVAVSIAAFFLLHPANHGPNFYDIHQISFLPISVFLLFYFLERKSIFGFMISVLLILGIKDDMYILLLFVSLFIYLNGRENLRFVWYSFISAFIYGFAYNTVGRIWNIIPTFFYYEGIMVDKNGGLLELIKTVIANPLHAIRAVITKDKILYVAQLFGPVAFIPLLRKQNFLLFVYGLAATLLATRPFLYKISFQYVWYVVPFLFIGLVYVLKDVQTINQSLISPLKTLKGRIYPLLITVFFASFIYSWQYGAFPNNTYFIGGFRKVDFTFTAEDKRRLQALNNIVARIPPNASISASDCITPHLLNHVNVKKFASPDNSEPEYLFLRDPNFERQDYLEHLKDIHAYKVIYREGGFQLLKRSK